MTLEANNNQPSTILIIDDSPENRLLLSSQLKTGSNYRILQASDGQTGIDLALAMLPDLILLDVMMPRMNGFEVCTHIKANPSTATIPIIMVTALRDVQYRIRGIEVGADEFLSRPHHREELLVRVRSLIQLKRARERLEEERNRLQLLYDVSRATTTQLDLNQIMIEIITHTCHAVEAAKGSILLLDETGEVTHKVLIRAGESAKVVGRATQEIFVHGWAGWLVRHNRADLVDDISGDDRWIALPDESDQTGSAIGVALSRAHRVVGVLILTHPKPGHFKAEHLSMLETIGAQLTAAIENAYLFSETNEQRSKLQAILAQTNDAIITTDEDLIISTFNQSARNVFRLDGMEVIGRNVHEIGALDVLHSLFAQAQSQSVSQEISVPGGLTLYASVSPIVDVGYAAVMQDLTELKRNEALRLEQERREKQLLKETFLRYMSPRLVEQVLSYEDEEGLLSKRERRLAVVMFADLRGFTRMIVNVEPNMTIQLLNEFFANMTEIVHEFDGTIFDLAGDELMVGFNVPLDQDDAAYRSLLTAVTMQHRFDKLREKWFASVETDLGLGIGIDQGHVIVGNVGAETRMNFAMVGEAVNTAHRLVEMALDGQIVVTEVVFRSLHDKAPRLIDILNFEALGAVDIRGKTVPEVLYRLNVKREDPTQVAGSSLSD